MSEDVVTLVLPRERDFGPVARLVLAGLAARRNLTYQGIEDLQLALDGLLEREDSAEALTVHFALLDEAITAEIGPFDRDGLRSDLERDEPGVVGLRRLLDTLADTVEVEEGPSGTVVRLMKRIELEPEQTQS